MRTVTASLAGLVLLLCQLEPLRGQTQAPAAVSEPGERRYRVATEDSEILIRIFRAGAFARFGHNHVISATGIEGMVTVDAGGAGSSFVLRVPIEALEVDNPDVRREAGDDFATEPSAADIAGTRENMLGPRVLDVAEYPTITVNGTTEGAASATAASVTFEVRQNRTEKVVPIEARVTDRSIRVTGALELSHEELGLRPFRALAGALRVAERMELSFEINAFREE